jgi:hypothetical protein
MAGLPLRVGFRCVIYRNRSYREVIRDKLACVRDMRMIKQVNMNLKSTHGPANTCVGAGHREALNI